MTAPEILRVSIEVLELCREAGLMKMGRVALDGRKVAGNAALARNRTREALETEVEKIPAEAEPHIPHISRALFSNLSLCPIITYVFRS